MSRNPPLEELPACCGSSERRGDWGAFTHKILALEKTNFNGIAPLAPQVPRSRDGAHWDTDEVGLPDSLDFLFPVLHHHRNWGYHKRAGARLRAPESVSIFLNDFCNA